MIRQNVLKTLLLLFLFSFLLLFSGCVQETSSRVQEPEQEPEQEQEQITDPKEEQERLEEERRLTEERELEERKQREEALREELGPFFVELPPLEQKENPAVKAKGIYLTGHTAANPARLAELISLVEQTELNAMVIDVKNDHGLMMYRSEIEIVDDVNANKGVVIKDIDEVMAQLQEHNIYPIARIVVFRDPHLPEIQNEWAIQKQGGGSRWRDRSGFAWVNPYEKNVWDYNIAIAKEAALKGFREIQFDYVRFPENARRVDREAEFPNANGRAKDEAIEEFLTYASEQLKEYNVHLSADVFGVIATSKGDADGIGQTWEKISPVVDIICPMVYPSHYGPGYFGYSVPDANPGGVINRSMTDAIKRNAPLKEPARIRPWLQSFTATWVSGNIPYGAKEVRQQIDAAFALGIDEFLIWNPGNRYREESFLTEEAAVVRQDEHAAVHLEEQLDDLGRTKQTALQEYLDAVKKQNWRDVYLWQVRDFSMNEEEFKAWVDQWTCRVTAYTITDNTEANNHTKFSVLLSVQMNENQEQLSETFTPVLENGIWKVNPTQSFLSILIKEPLLQETSG